MKIECAITPIGVNKDRFRMPCLRHITHNIFERDNHLETCKKKFLVRMGGCKDGADAKEEISYQGQKVCDKELERRVKCS